MSESASLKRKRSQSQSSEQETSPSKTANSAGIVVKDKKQKACLNCRRSKLKCVVSTEGAACVRCATRKEECRFKTRAHDDEWQEATSNRIDDLSRSVEQLSQSMSLVLRHLNLPADTARPPPSAANNSSAPHHSSPWLSPPPSSADPAVTATASMAFSLDHSNVDGAEALLAQTETSDDYYPVASSSAHPQGNSPPAAGTGLYHLLDDLINTAPINPSSTAAAKHGEGLGESDPRPDIIKAGVVNLTDANVLVDHFHAHLAHHLFGFPLQVGAWPYLPEGKPTITPLILGVACLVPAERLPHYHHVFDLLMTELNEPIFNATPGYSNSNRPPTTTDPDAEAATLDAPDLDLELGIGPEEITALCVAATFTCSDKSDAMARTVFEWTRGYLKTFKNPPPHPLTLGEVCGLLPPRRNLTFENWLRLWLFAYVGPRYILSSWNYFANSNFFRPDCLCSTGSTPQQTSRRI
ncbi:hypothetical protein DL93DRAFT_2083956 [Clavulina sp. PMI_390]|nr:hypothetical protein DL93DRAFT_2083956 [Clavulina sp. PMI_390]